MLLLSFKITRSRYHVKRLGKSSTSMKILIIPISSCFKDILAYKVEYFQCFSVDVEYSQR